MLFEVAILSRPTKKEQEEGETEKLVFGPIAVVARDQQSAAIAAVMGGNVPTLDMSRCEVLCRPFA
jgi:hypothetical protein